MAFEYLLKPRNDLPNRIVYLVLIKDDAGITTYTYHRASWPVVIVGRVYERIIWTTWADGQRTSLISK